MAAAKNGQSAAFKAQQGKGRPKGVPNKSTKAIKDMVLAALDKAGGIAYLVDQAEKNPQAFMTLVGKVIPLQVNGAGDEGEHLHKVKGALTWKPSQ